MSESDEQKKISPRSKARSKIYEYSFWVIWSYLFLCHLLLADDGPSTLFRRLVGQPVQQDTNKDQRY